MEPSLQELQPQPQPEQEQAWRGETEDTSAADMRHRILSKIGLKVPVGTMNARAMLLTDLLGKFKPSKANLHGDCCQESIKDRFHFVKKDRKKSCKRGRTSFMYRRYGAYDAALENLVSQMKSPGFAIQQNQSEVDVNHSFVRFSLYDKTPREPLPQINISEANSPENRPDMTQKFENCSIASESHKISADMDTFQQ